MDASQTVLKAVDLASQPVARLEDMAGALKVKLLELAPALARARDNIIRAKLVELRGIEEAQSLAYRRLADQLIGPGREALADELIAHAADEDRHAQIVMRRLVAMGGSMPVEAEIGKSTEYPPAGDIAQALQILAENEYIGILKWKQLRDLFAEDEPFRFQIESILEDEQHHTDDLNIYQSGNGATIAFLGP
jgi:bacterioferritin (cytochrome b1)